MFGISTIEIIGYAASVLVAVSLMMSAILKLRVINLIGASIFSVYGFIIGALPVGLLNGFIALVDIYYLVEIFTTKEYFQVLEVKPDSAYLKYFLEFHSKDIKKFIPSFSFNPEGSCIVMFVLRNSVPAGLVCADCMPDNSVFITIDYAIPGYRDFKMAKYVFSKIFREKEVKKIFTDPGNEMHEKYLRKIGFEKTELGGKPSYMLEIKK